MSTYETARARLAEIPSVTIRENAPLSEYARFGLGGPAALLAESADATAFGEMLAVARAGEAPYTVIGGGSNLIVADEGYPGIVLRYTAASITARERMVRVDSGAVLQDLVDFTVDRGLAGLHTMTGIPGWVGGAIYGNAGAYGHSIMERVREVRFCDGREVRTVDNAGCEFRYRESVFKRNKGWIVLDAGLELEAGDAAALRAEADRIRGIRDAKYPPSMKCAGSIFKNLILAELADPVRAVVPPKVVIEGKVPSAWFLDQVGAKGEAIGDIRVAEYHANLIYNAGQGTARDLRRLIADLKRRVHERFGLELEEEVQYVGFDLVPS
jgi:UDP-N-acetylmuramate dehydrogenase